MRLVCVSNTKRADFSRSASFEIRADSDSNFIASSFSRVAAAVAAARTRASVSAVIRSDSFANRSEASRAFFVASSYFASAS